APAAFNTFVAHDALVIEKGRKYKLAFAIKVLAGTPPSILFHGKPSQVLIVPQASPEWKMNELEFVAEDNFSTLLLSWGHYTAGTVLIDDVSIVKIEPSK